jgi:hypothetical protein
VGRVDREVAFIGALFAAQKPRTNSEHPPLKLCSQPIQFTVILGGIPSREARELCDKGALLPTALSTLFRLTAAWPRDPSACSALVAGIGRSTPMRPASRFGVKFAVRQWFRSGTGGWRADCNRSSGKMLL